MVLESCGWGKHIFAVRIVIFQPVKTDTSLKIRFQKPAAGESKNPNCTNEEKQKKEGAKDKSENLHAFS